MSQTGSNIISIDNEEKALIFAMDMYQERSYRPTLLSIVQNSDGNILYVQSAKENGYGNIHLPQGGFEKTDLSLESAVRRELIQETKLESEKILSVNYLGGVHLVDKPDRDLRGFSNGKAYLLFGVNYDSSSITPDFDEIKNAFWGSPMNFKHYAQNICSQKKYLINNGLQKMNMLKNSQNYN